MFHSVQLDLHIVLGIIMSSNLQLSIPAPENFLRKNRKRVLEEDEFVEKLESVIEQQYFPHLSRMKKQLDHLQRNEMFSLRTLRQTYKTILRAESAEVDSMSSSNARKLTVAEFFAKFTSEDNHSFEEVFAKDTANRRRTFHWMHEALDNLAITNGDGSNEKKAGMLMLYYVGNKVLSAEERSRMDAILAGEETVGDSRPNSLDSWAFRVRNQLMFYPELEDSMQISKVTASRSGNLGTSNGKRFVNPLPGCNPSVLMIGNGDESSTQKNNLQMEVFKVPARRPPSSLASEKVIQTATVAAPGDAFLQSVERYLTGSTFNKGLVSNSPWALRTTPTPLEAPHTPTTIDSESPRYRQAGSMRKHAQNDPVARLSSLSHPIAELSSGSKDSQFSLVEMSPMPVPGRGALESPLMTWGNIIGTPVLLSANSGEGVSQSLSDEDVDQEEVDWREDRLGGELDIGGGGDIAFHFQNQRRREVLAHRLEAETQAKKRQKRDNSGGRTSSGSRNDRASERSIASSVSIANTPLSIVGSSANSVRSRHSSAHSHASNNSTVNRQKRLSELSPAAQVLARKVQESLLRQKARRHSVT